MKKTKRTFYDKYIKRLLDLMIAVVGLLISSPIFLICVVAIKIDDPKGNVIFKDRRNGKGGKEFYIIKFRTMQRNLSGKDLRPTDNTLTGIGTILRKFSLDEIPQLINILRGQMSLIGPRPLPVLYFEWFNETELHRFDVRPGITGLAQISGRVNLSWDKRFQYDVEYVKNISFLLDLKIFSKTIMTVLSSKDVLIGNDKQLNFIEHRQQQLSMSSMESETTID